MNTGGLNSDAGLFKQGSHCFAGLRTFLDPGHSFVRVNLTTRFIIKGIIGSQNFQKPSIPRHSGICRYNPVKRFLFCSSPS